MPLRCGPPFFRALHKKQKKNGAAAKKLLKNRAD